jgi:glucokinase
MINDKIIGVDIGGTKISVGLISGNVVTKRYKTNTEASKPQYEVIQNVFKAIDQVWESDVKGIGVGVPGLVDHEKGVVYHLQNIPSWQEVRLKEHIEKRYNVPTYINNDANCFTLGEKYFGEGVKYKNFIGITLGTGVGSGIIINNKLYSGVNSGAGEFGSIPYKSSNYEKICGGSFFEDSYGMTGQTAFKNAQNGDAAALKAWDEYGCNLGRFIHLLMFALAPEAVIIGGSISKGFCFFQDSLFKTINEFPFEMVKKNFEVKCALNSDNALMGAGALYLNATNSISFM